MKGSIYKITNDINDKVYVGKTLLSIEKRFKEHKQDCQKTRYEKRPLYNAMNKYGVEHFQISLIEECPIEILSEREKYWIKELNTYHNGYNATLGGDGTQYIDTNDFIGNIAEHEYTMKVAAKYILIIGLVFSLFAILV
jgi:group I intron endonuclease